MKVIGRNKVQATRDDIERFNATWPGSELRTCRSYWFEFDAYGDLIDTDVPQQDDGAAAAALAQDCYVFLIGDNPLER